MSELLSQHDHGNCELCDEIEARLRAVEEERDGAKDALAETQAEFARHMEQWNTAQAEARALREALEIVKRAIDVLKPIYKSGGDQWFMFESNKIIDFDALLATPPAPGGEGPRVGGR